MLDARYKDRYFHADKKQSLREMLYTAGQDGIGHNDSAHWRRGPTTEEATDRAETSLLDMYDEIIFGNGTTEQMNNETAQQVKEIGFDYVLLVMGTYVTADKITF